MLYSRGLLYMYGVQPVRYVWSEMDLLKASWLTVGSLQSPDLFCSVLTELHAWHHPIAEAAALAAEAQCMIQYRLRVQRAHAVLGLFF